MSVEPHSNKGRVLAKRYVCSCVICGRAFPACRSAIRFCGAKACAIAAQRLRCVPDRRRTATCEQCGQQFTYEVGRGRDKRRICGDECRKARTTQRLAGLKATAAEKVCTIEGCGRPRRGVTLDLCEVHYMRVRRHGDIRSLSPPKEQACRQCGTGLSEGQLLYCSPRCAHRYHGGVPDHRRCVQCRRSFPTTERRVTCSEKCQRRRVRRLAAAAMKRNPERYRESLRRASHKRRALKAATAIVDVSPVVIHRRDGWKCGLCGKAVLKRARWPHPLSATLDHIVPLARGGSHTEDNLQCAHLRCNQSKGARVCGQLRLPSAA